MSNTECNSLFKLAALEDRVEEDIWVCAGYREGGKVVVTMALMYNDHPCGQSHKNPVSASAMLTGKFLQIRKVFATCSFLAEEFPDTLQYKISR